MTCNDCGRHIDDCDRYGCREVRGTIWDRDQRREPRNVPTIPDTSKPETFSTPPTKGAGR